MVLTLLILCVGAMSADAPPLEGPKSGAQVVLADVHASSALPSQAWTITLDVGGKPPPRVARRTAAFPPPPTSIRGHAPARGSDADRPALRSGAFLLGLPATPANAPPRS